MNIKDKQIKILRKISSILSRWQAQLVINQGKDNVFIEHIMDPHFNYKKYQKIINPYFKKFGFSFNMVEPEYYKRVCGIESNLYITQTFFSYYLIPFLNKSSYIQDKNKIRQILGEEKDSIFRMPKQIVYNRNGILYDGNNEVCDIKHAICEIMKYEQDIILKPTTNTTWGKGIIKINRDKKSVEQIDRLIKLYQKDFSFEECICQHPELAKFNETSLNTIRVATYRKPNGKIKPLYALLRFGKKGEIIDNASAGGNLVKIDIADGFIDRKIIRFKTIISDTINDELPTHIPYFNKIIDATLYLHSKVSDLNYIGWDMSISKDGTPIVIEFNSRPAVECQLSTSPIFCREDLDEIMQQIVNYKIDGESFPIIKFPSVGNDYYRNLNY